jgi:hypothetical protein
MCNWIGVHIQQIAFCISPSAFIFFGPKRGSFLNSPSMLESWSFLPRVHHAHCPDLCPLQPISACGLGLSCLWNSHHKQ